MQIVVKGKNLDLTDALKDYAESRIRKMTRHFDGIISADVTLSTERNWHIVEVTVYASGFVLRGEERTNDMYASIDMVLDKLSKQLKKQKGKWEKRQKIDKFSEAEFFKVELPRGDEEYDENEEVVMEDPKVVRVPMNSNKPMTVEEAVKEMQTHGFTFFMFINAKTELINIIYRRREGFGLVDPSLDME